MTVPEYKRLYPDAPTCSYSHSDETLGKMRGPREATRGQPKSAEHRAKLSAARTGRKFKPHSPETIRKMQEAWRRRKADKEAFEAYCQGVSERMSTDEMKVALRQRTAQSVKNGTHNGKSKDTALEKRFARFAEVRGIEIESQFVLHTSKGDFVFDFYIPSMNMLVETDGEYWHGKSLEVFTRDRVKSALARDAGYVVARISDRDWKPEVIFEPVSAIANHNQAIMDSRLAHLLRNLGVEGT